MPDMSWPFLYFAGDRLSLAELACARLDGDVVEIGDAYMPADAVETMRHVFPSLLGVSLSRRMRGDTFHEILGKVREAEDMDEARRSAAIATLVDKLKSSFSKQYDAQFIGDDTIWSTEEGAEE